jgi:hypothetical protein
MGNEKMEGKRKKMRVIIIVRGEMEKLYLWTVY